MKDILVALLGNPVVMGVLLVIIFAIVAIIVKKTKTQKDDAIFAMITHAFNLAEKIIPDNTGPAWMQKVDKALQIFKQEYEKRNGKEPTEDLLQLAKDEWSILANEIKKAGGKVPNS